MTALLLVACVVSPFLLVFLVRAGARRVPDPIIDRLIAANRAQYRQGMEQPDWPRFMLRQEDR